MIKNPFPGPQPYRASDRARFYGRDDLAYKLQATILATRCVTVHGPSGAGKSSLVQAAVLPSLIDSQDIRVARVDAWPENEDPARWLALSLFSELRLGELPEGTAPGEAVLSAAKRAARGSSRLMVVYLDQIEQLFFTGRTFEETEPLFACLQELVELPLRTVRVILSLREDYLGRFRDRLRDRGRALDSSFRVGPLTVAELTTAVCQAAAAGEPPQQWSADRMRALMLQVRLPGQTASDDAEAQAAYAQIVCRALFQQRAQGDAPEGDATLAEPILRRYLETTLADLGSSRDAAQRLLEDHLVTADGSRTLRTEKELLRIVPGAELRPILKALESAAILHAEEHQGSRYFEIGHDWLARKVFEQRQEREAQEERRRHEEEQQREVDRQKKEAAERLAKARRQRLTFGAIAAGSVVFAVVTSVLAYQANEAKKKATLAELKAKEEERRAKIQTIEANDQRLMAGYSLLFNTEPAFAMKLLPEVTHPREVSGWVSIASDALGDSSLVVTLRGHTSAINTAVFSADGKRVLTASDDGSAHIWNADGTGEPALLDEHGDGGITSASLSSDGQRVLTISADGKAYVHRADGKGKPVELKGGTGKVLSGAFSPDDKGSRVVLGSEDDIARVYDSNGDGSPIDKLADGPGDPKGRVNYVTYLGKDGLLVATAMADKTVRVWTLGAKGSPLKLGGHKEPVQFIAASPDGQVIVTTSHETSARLFVLGSQGKGLGAPRELTCVRHDKDDKDKGEAVHAAVSPDGAFVAVACSNNMARVFPVAVKGNASAAQPVAPPGGVPSAAQDKDASVVLEGAADGVTFVSFSPDSKLVAAASRDRTARVYPVNGQSRPLLLRGHTAALGSVVWNAQGTLLLTAAKDDTSNDYSAKIWSAKGLKSLWSGAGDATPSHAASLSADGALVVAAYDDKTARVCHVNGSCEAPLKGHEGWVANAALSPDGKRVVTAAFDKTARIWSADGAGAPIVLTGHQGDVHFAAFSADGKRVVTAAEDRTAMVWDADKGGSALVTLGGSKGHEDWLTWAAFSRDGARVVTASDDHTARVWSADGKGDPIVLEGHQGAVTSAVFDAEGKRVITASEDGTARVWSADGKGEPIVLRGPTGRALLAAVLSGDGQKVAASTMDGQIFVWSSDGKDAPVTLRTAPPDLQRAAPPAIALTFVENDKALLAVLADSTTHKWQIDVNALVEGLRSAHADCLPPPVRTQFLLESDECAENAFELCESGYKRLPAPPVLPACVKEPASPADEGAPAASQGPIAASAAAHTQAQRWVKDLGGDGRHVKLVVLPGDARVLVAGVPARRRDGAVELVGKKEDVVRVRVSKAGKYAEKEVKILDKGADPVLIDLTALTARQRGAGAEKPLKPGQGNFGALMPSDDN